MKKHSSITLATTPISNTKGKTNDSVKARDCTESPFLLPQENQRVPETSLKRCNRPTQVACTRYHLHPALLGTQWQQENTSYVFSETCHHHMENFHRDFETRAQPTNERIVQENHFLHMLADMSERLAQQKNKDKKERREENTEEENMEYERNTLDSDNSNSDYDYEANSLDEDTSSEDEDEEKEQESSSSAASVNSLFGGSDSDTDSEG